MEEGDATDEFVGGFDPQAVRRSAIRVTGLLVAVGLIALLAPGLGTLRGHLGSASVPWLIAAVGFEALSGLSYVLMLKPIFALGMTWGAAQRLGWSELAMGSIVPASGVSGLALGAWVFNRVGVEPTIIARRSIAFYLIKGAVNFVAVAVVGVAMFVGIGPHLNPLLTIVPAIIATGVIAFVAMLPRLGPGGPAAPGAGRLRRSLVTARRTLIHAVGEADEILRRKQFAVYFGTFGYWFFDNLVLWATFHAFGVSPPITVILMGYLLGQLGGLLPIPGGIGGIDGGLVGAMVVYGIAAGPA